MKKRKLIFIETGRVPCVGKSFVGVDLLLKIGGEIE
jgi:hypothetical protein